MACIPLLAPNITLGGDVAIPRRKCPDASARGQRRPKRKLGVRIPFVILARAQLDDIPEGQPQSVLGRRTYQSDVGP